MKFLSALFRDLRQYHNLIDADELFVSSRLKSAFSTRDYRVLDNLLLPSMGNISTTQIDHIVVSVYGIFVIETKSHQGWIYGTTNKQNWTQVLYRSKKPIYNPLWQNYAHVKAIETLLGRRLKTTPLSLVAFPSAERLIINDTSNIGTAEYIEGRILTFRKMIYTHEEAAQIIKLLSLYNLKASSAHRQHAKNVSALLSTVQIS